MRESGDELGFELSLRVVMFHEAIAQRLGINNSEHKMLDLVVRHPDGLTPGDLAARTGLSNASVTKIVDSLHRRGFVHRTRDERDRRSVRVLAAPGYWQATRPATARLADQIYALNTNFTPAELAAITRWVGGVTEALRAQTEALRDGTD